jgi:hypothetical protein
MICFARRKSQLFVTVDENGTFQLRATARYRNRILKQMAWLNSAHVSVHYCIPSLALEAFVLKITFFGIFRAHVDFIFVPLRSAIHVFRNPACDMAFDSQECLYLTM